MRDNRLWDEAVMTFSLWRRSTAWRWLLSESYEWSLHFNDVQTSKSLQPHSCFGLRLQFPGVGHDAVCGKRSGSVRVVRRPTFRSRQRRPLEPFLRKVIGIAENGVRRLFAVRQLCDWRRELSDQSHVRRGQPKGRYVDAVAKRRELDGRIGRAVATLDPGG